VVFLGRVEKTEQETFPIPGGGYRIGMLRMSVRVEEAFKGVRNTEVLQLEQPGDNCTPKFKEDERVMFYLNPAKAAGKWVAHGCHRTRSVESAADDLQFLRALPWAATRSRLSGAVSVYEPSQGKGLRRIGNLAGIEIQVRSKGILVETSTNSSGVYEIYDLPPGVYQVEAKAPKDWKLRFLSVEGGMADRRATSSSAVDLKVGAGVSVNFMMTEDNLLTGRVLDPHGRPLVGVGVGLELAAGRTGRYFQPVATCNTNEKGEFRIAGVATGEYRLAANGSGKITVGTPFPAVYFPDTEDKAKAEVLTVGAGTRRENLELRIPRLAK
jgi:hypothetical protein